MSKGSGDRVRDKKRYDENFEKVDWSDSPYGTSVMEQEEYGRLCDNEYLSAWLEARNKVICDE